MASKAPIECPLCHEEMTRGQNLEEHLTRAHEKRQLVKFVAAETMALEGADVSE